MTTFTATEITLLLGAVSTAIGTLLMVIQRSTCTYISCCGAKCEREVRTLEELESQQDITQHTTIDPIQQDAIEKQLSNIKRSLSPTVKARVSELESRRTW